MGSAPTLLGLRTQQISRKKKKKLPPKKGENRVDLQLQNAFAWPRAEIRLRTVTWSLSCCFLKDVKEESRETFALGQHPTTKPGIVLCIQPTHSEMDFAPPCGASGTRWIPARNLLPSPEQSFFLGQTCAKQAKGHFIRNSSHSAFPHSTCRKRLGDVLHLHSFKKINLLLTY